jgi:hypothetical protein
MLVLVLSGAETNNMQAVPAKKERTVIIKLALCSEQLHLLHKALEAKANTWTYTHTSHEVGGRREYNRNGHLFTHPIDSTISFAILMILNVKGILHGCLSLLSHF